MTASTGWPRRTDLSTKDSKLFPDFLRVISRMFKWAIRGFSPLNIRRFHDVIDLVVFWRFSHESINLIKYHIVFLKWDYFYVRTCVLLVNLEFDISGRYDGCMPKKQGWISGFGQKTGSGALYLKRREIFKSLKIIILDIFKSLLFCFHTFGVRRPL